MIELTIDDLHKKWRHFAYRDPRTIRIYFFTLLNIYSFFFFSSLSFSFPVRTCLWFAVLFCTSDKVFWTMLHKSKSFQPVEGARPDEIWSNILSAPSVRRFFFLSLNRQHEKRLSAGHETGLGPRLSSGFISSDNMTGRGGRHHRRRSFLMQQSN